MERAVTLLGMGTRGPELRLSPSCMGRQEQRGGKLWQAG